MKTDPQKCHLIFNGDEQQGIRIDGKIIESSSHATKLRTTIENQLNFKKYANDLSKMADKQFHASARITPNMSEKTYTSECDF